MPEPLSDRIIQHLRDPKYQPLRPRQLAKAMQEAHGERYNAFRDAMKQLVADGSVTVNDEGEIQVSTAPAIAGANEMIGTFRQNRKGFGFVIPSDIGAADDLYIGERDNPGGAITGDVVRAKITSRGMRDGKPMLSGRIIEVVERKNKRFVGSLQRKDGQWFVLPDGNAYTEPIYTPDAATKYIKPGTKVVVEITEFATIDEAAMGVITDTIGNEGDKDVDLRSTIVQFGLPQDFPEEVKQQASDALATFKATKDFGNRYDLRDIIICTIDPDDAKDYDDAISLEKLEDGNWELGVHIADVSNFVPVGSPLDVEAKERGNSTYFPGFVIPMLPEVLSNGICSLQEGVPRLCKSAFIVYSDAAQPVRSRFANTIIHSNARLRYREAQDIIDGRAEIFHPDGPRKITDYAPEVVSLLADMNELSRRIQKRRHAAGQLVLALPKMSLVLSDEGKVIDAVPEDESFTHTLIEMFMVEANESVARLLDTLDVPFLRRTHPDPEAKSTDRLSHFVGGLGYPMPKEIDRHVLQSLLAKVKGKPEAFAVNLAVLRSLSRAEYSPKKVGHFALASTHYGHFTSPIRRYADLTIHRLLDAYFESIQADFRQGPTRARPKTPMENVPTFDECMAVGKHISYTERRSEDAERELRQVKLLELMQNHIGEQFTGVIVSVTNFGIFIQIQQYLIEGLVRYPQLFNERWDVDEKAGVIKGQRTGRRIRIGDVAKVTIARVDLPRRELDLSVDEILTRGSGESASTKKGKGKSPATTEDRPAPAGKPRYTEGTTKRNQRSKTRDRKKSPRKKK